MSAEDRLLDRTTHQLPMLHLTVATFVAPIVSNHPKLIFQGEKGDREFDSMYLGYSGATGQPDGISRRNRQLLIDFGTL